MKDAAMIDYESEFADQIRKIFFDRTPSKIIETGTHYGMGSTRIITSLIKYIPILNAKFFSIECNEVSISIAKDNLKKLDLLDNVEILSGLSIPEKMLPSISSIEHNLNLIPNVKCDHSPEDAAINYQKEINNFSTDNCLGYACEKFEYQPDFILLDSAGHLGWAEFWYVNFMLRGKCIIALDDIHHVKHAKSYRCIKNCSNFKIIAEGKEKFGYAIIEVTP